MVGGEEWEMVGGYDVGRRGVVGRLSIGDDTCTRKETQE